LEGEELDKLIETKILARVIIVDIQRQILFLSCREKHIELMPSNQFVSSSKVVDGLK